MAEVDAGALAPVVPVAPAADAAPAPGSTADQVVETPEGEKKPDAPQERAKFDAEQQKEVDRIVAKRVAQESRRLERVARAEARAEFAERQLEERTRQPATGQPKGKPQPKDYESPEAYVEATVNWTLEQREAARAKDDTAKRSQREEGESVRAVLDAVSKGSEEFEDFQEVAFADDLQVTQAMAYAIAESKAPAKTLHYLGTHPQEAARIARLSPTLQAHEIHSLVSKVTAAPAPTRTPAPIVPNSGNSSGGKSLKELIGGSQEDFEKKRSAYLAKKR